MFGAPHHRHGYAPGGSLARGKGGMGNRLALLVLIMIGGRLVGNRLVVTGARLPAAPSVLGRF